MSDFPYERTKRSILRCERPAGTPSWPESSGGHPTIGLGFNLGRPDARLRIEALGLDFDALLAGEQSISERQMDLLFDEELGEALERARSRLPDFDELPAHEQDGVLEMIMWIGPSHFDAVLAEVERRAPRSPGEASEWYDRMEPAAFRGFYGLSRWGWDISRARTTAQTRYEAASHESYDALPDAVQVVLTLVVRDYGNEALAFWRAVGGHRWAQALDELEQLRRPHPARTEVEIALRSAVEMGQLQNGRRPASGRERSARPSGLIFESFGFVGEVVTEDPALLEALPALLPPDSQRVELEPHSVFKLSSAGVITINGNEVHRVTDPGVALDALGSVVRHRLASEAPTHVFIHAGVVEIDGWGIVIPGASFSGKTTLVAELLRWGAVYGSDEYAVVDQAGLIEPFAQPLSVRSHDAAGPTDRVAVPACRVASKAIRARMIVITRYRPGAKWQPVQPPSSEGAFALLEHTVAAYRRPQLALAAVARLASGAVVLSGDRGEATDTAAALIEAIDPDQRHR
jgi:hypothetical protein